jgi:dipeptidyl aminopeptidase/acylaminoacyl peptidase
MILRLASLLAVVILVSLVACSKQKLEGVPPYLPPTIPLKDFFDNPKISSATISPDGLKFAFLKPSVNNRMNVWVCDIAAGIDSAKVVTNDSKRGISSFHWTWDSRYLLYSQDEGGNENFHVYRVDPSLAEPNAVDLTPFPKTRAGLLDLPRERPNEALVSINNRDPRVFDVHKLDISTGQLTLVEKNPGDVDSWEVDTNGVVRGCNVVIGTDTELRVRDGATGPFRKLARYTYDEDPRVHGFSKDGTFLYFSSSRGSDTARLVKLDLKTAQETPIDSDPTYDFGSALISDLTHDLIAVAYQRARLEYKSFDEQFSKDLEILAKVHDGDILFRSCDAQEQKWIIAYNSPTDPGATYLYDRATGKAEFLYRPRPWLKSQDLVEMQIVEFPSRDGLTLHGYLTLPKGRLAEKLPLIEVVHGGPWARDDWGYDPEAQFLANRGYAVMQINYRGSTGYGKAFTNAGDKEWGGKMTDDMVDAVTWAIQKGYADPKRVGIYGGSYGGYATLAALAFRPGLFKCGIDYVGISNLLTFMTTIPPYWEPFRPVMYKRVGNPNTEKDFLKSRSPLFFADKIDVPLFIAQGFNDPRVNHAEAEQIVEALKKRGHPVEYLVKMDEGHGFANPENRMEFYQKMEAFLAQHLK